MDREAKPKIVVIVGPTGSGKTALSLLLAKYFNGEVINADSRQVYRGLDIGTEKVSIAEMDGIPHHLLDIAEPTEHYTADRFKKDANAAIADITTRGKLPILAGGTFFYIDTLLQKINAPAIEPDFDLRDMLEAKEVSELFTELEAKDPVRAATIDRHNKRRLVRALEILMQLPSVPLLQPKESPYDALVLGITVDKEELKGRLKARAQRALERGLIAETKALMERGVSRERLCEFGLEYPLVLQFLDGTITNDELIQKLGEKNWQYAKRQLVWLKRDTSINWFPLTATEDILQKVTQFLQDSTR